MNQLTLDFTKPRYPYAPGHRGVSTSIAAARDASAWATELEQRVLGALEKHGPLTFWEVADLTGIPFDSAQPCVSRLHARGKVINSGIKRPNPKGRMVIAWRKV